MKKICISKDWTFCCPEMKERQQIDLPHDYVIQMPRKADALGGASDGYYTGTSGEYTKYITFDGSEHVILDIDGAYMCSRVYFNENLVNFHPYGYTPILVDLTPKMRKNGVNKLNVVTQNLQPSSRWYSGAGIYRDVYLWTGGKIRIEPRDIFIHTVDANNDTACVAVEVTVTADFDAKVTLFTSIKGADGLSVCEKALPIDVKLGKNTQRFEFKIENPKLWDAENPNLYYFNAEVLLDGTIQDQSEVRFGIKTVSASATKGLLINGKTVNLQGGCIHHDHGGLGAASFPTAERRKLTKLKNAGFNAVRIAHNPPSLTLLEICDEIGLYVMDEAFDMWNMPMNKYDYSMWFQYCWQDDIRDMILRDRNHPCVLSYSIGNEILERCGISDGAYWSRTLADEIRKYDNTKFVTSGTCMPRVKPEDDAPEEYKETYMSEYSDIEDLDERMEAVADEYMAPLDIVGYNYAYPRYESIHEKHPERVIWGSETRPVNSKFYNSWGLVLKNPYIIGDFTWTAYDNIGEVGCGMFMWAREGELNGLVTAPYPWRTCYQGDFDLCGYRRPQSYFRETFWVKDCELRIFTTHPEHYGEGFSGTGWHWYDVHETWTFEDKYLGKPVKTEVYTDADEVQFILNGKDLGKVCQVEHIASMDIPYEKGELTAISFKNGKEIRRHSLHTVKNSAKIMLKPEQDSLKADNRDLLYVGISVVDENGDRVTEAENEITCKVEGGELMTLFSANPCNEDEYTSGKCHVFDGRAIAVVRTKKVGNVILVVEGEGLQKGVVTIKATKG